MHRGGSNYDFVASAAERLEVCLGNLRLIAGLMHKKGGESSPALDAIREKTSHLLDVTANLSDFARLGRDHAAPLLRSRMVLSEVIEQVIEALAPQAATRLQVFVFTVGAGERELSADYGKLLPAIFGLLRHCLEIAPPSAQILIRESTTRTAVRVDIDVPVEEAQSMVAEGAPAEGLDLALLLAAHPFGLHHGSLRTSHGGRQTRFLAELPLTHG